MPADLHNSAGGEPPGGDASRELAAVLRQHRLQRGMSLRMLARALGMSAHSGLLDYETGRRIPPPDLITGYERVFELPAGELMSLRSRAFAERAGQRSGAPEAGGRLTSRAGRQRVGAWAARGWTAGGGWARRGRRRAAGHRAAAAVTAALAVAVVAVAITAIGARPGRPVIPAHHAVPRTHSPAATAVPTGSTDMNNDGITEPVRRAGSMVLPAGRLIDLDSLAPGWGMVIGARPHPSDLEFTLDHRSLTGNINAVLAVLPPGTPGTRTTCGRQEAYGVELWPHKLKVGVQFCVITDQNRYALGTVTAIRYDHGLAADLTIAFRVWQHKDAV